MKDTILRLNKSIEIGLSCFNQMSSDEINRKPSADKWSKKEILGHLIDSGIYNLQRFTEVQYESAPYKMRLYDQDELVKANDYQNTEIQELLDFWTTLNKRIGSIMAIQNEESLKSRIEMYEGEFITLKYLMTDYVEHMGHHLNQIKE